MRTLTEKYNLVLEEKYSKKQFITDARRLYPNFITQLNSFNDTVSILKNKGLIFEMEVEKYQEAESPDYYEERTSDDYSLDHLERAIDFELEEKGFDTVAINFSQEDYKEARVRALANLKKDKNFYLHKLSNTQATEDRPDVYKEVDMKAALSKENIESLKDSDYEMTRIKLKEGFKKLIKNMLLDSEEGR